MNNEQQHTAESLFNITLFYGDDITPQQNEWLGKEIDSLPDREGSQYWDLIRVHKMGYEV